jgi:TPP-dependent pyruvate/acetoin dehydrogenase alpha subunit
MRVGQCVHDPHVGGNPLVVEPLQAAAHHPRRGAVAERVRAAEAVPERSLVASGVEWCGEQRDALEVVGRCQLELAVEVAPVRRQQRLPCVPGRRERPPGDLRLRRRLRSRDELETTADALGVESPQKPSSSFGSDTASAPRYREAQRATGAARAARGEERGGAVDAALVVDRDDEMRLTPVRIQSAFDAGPAIDECHECESRLSRMAKVESKGTLVRADLKDFFREMLLIRRFEEKVEERFRAGELPGFLHVAIGQEAVAVGVCRALEDGDIIASTHRAHAHALAKGTTPNELMAELYGKVEGCSHGYGGSMHLYDVARGNMGANAVVGGGLPQIAGAALAFQLRGEPRVAVAFFGDGATNIGTFHESLNLAQLWKVPAVFVLEDNHWAESTPEIQHSPIRDLSKRAEAYGMKAVKVDGQDVEAVYKAARRALAHARKGDGPVLLHCDTYRLVGHYVGDPQVYRTKEEQHEVRETRDPITLLRERLELSDDEVAELEREVEEIVEASVAFAKNGTDPRPEDALKNVYA